MDDEQSEYEARYALRRYEARRERFAIAAMRSMLGKSEGHPTLWQFEEIAEAAVRMADALEERLYPDPGKQLLPPYEE